MSINKYRVFLAVVEKGSVTAAAEALGHSQSGVTQLLNALEGDLEVKLLERNRKGVRLTGEGAKLLPLIKKAVEADDAVINCAYSLSRGTDKTIRIASFTSVAVNWLPEIIREFSTAEPDVAIELVEAAYNNIEKTFEKQQIDLCFVPLPIEFGGRTFQLYRDRLLAVLPQNFDNRKLLMTGSGEYVCPVNVFETEPVISLVDTIDRDAKSVFDKAGIVPNIRYRVEDDYAMLAMVEKNLGVCIEPELILRDNKRNVRITELDPPAFRTIGVAFPDYEHAKPSAVKFLEFTENFIQNLNRI